MIRKIAGEVWKPLIFPGHRKLRNRYAVSNHGRIASFHEELMKDGKLLEGSLTTGYRTLNLHRSDNKGTLYVHREIAKLFLKKESGAQRYVIHINHDKLDNRARNLRWASQDEMIRHQQSSPAKLAYKQEQAHRPRGLKLSIPEVRKIKQLLSSKSRTKTISQLAKEFGVSEMTLYRIKSGENWASV